MPYNRLSVAATMKALLLNWTQPAMASDTQLISVVGRTIRSSALRGTRPVGSTSPATPDHLIIQLPATRCSRVARLQLISSVTHSCRRSRRWRRRLPRPRPRQLQHLHQAPAAVKDHKDLQARRDQRVRKDLKGQPDRPEQTVLKD